MQNIIKKLLTVKSIVTLLLTVVFCVLAIKGTITAELFMTVFTVVIAFYFGTQKVREEQDNKEGASNE